MGLSYKEMILKYKDEKRSLAREKRVEPKSKKKKPFIITGIINLANIPATRMNINRYSSLRDANKAIISFRKQNLYQDLEIIVKDES